jgi:pimeloyl-ACP methyl ester carboxylesterase
MGLDITIHKGSAGRPVIIFIHGLGMDKNMWLDPLETKIFAKNFPLKYFAAKRPKVCPETSGKQLKKLTIGDIPEKVDTLWDTLKNRDFSLACWSQKRPAGPISVAVEELGMIMKLVKKTFPGRPAVLIGHSRGGLVARKFMEKKTPEIKALITICTPHSGSALALLRKYFKPFSSVLKIILPKNAHGTASEALKRLNDLIEGDASKELLPGSDFFRSLKDSPSDGISYLSFGGTKTKLLTVYKYLKRDDELCPEPFVTIPDSLLQVLPLSLLPDELKHGKGDFLVSAKSSRLPWASEHHNVPANHIAILWNKKIINRTVELLEAM